MYRYALIAVLICGTITAACSGAEQGTSGVPESFGDKGFVLGPESGFAGGGSDHLYSMQLDSRGRVVASGFSNSDSVRKHGLLVRYLPDSRLDSSFGGGDGYVLFPRSGSSVSLLGQEQFDVHFKGIELDSDGRIVAVGWVKTGVGDEDIVTYKSLIARFTPDGALDTTFGDIDPATGGRLGYVVGQGSAIGNRGFAGYDDSLAMPRDEFVGVALDSRERIVVAGIARERYHEWFDRTLLARFNPDGSLDTTFNATGYQVGSAWDGRQWFGDGYWDELRAVAIQDDGKIVCTGWLLNENGDERTIITRHLPDGKFDPEFNAADTPGYVLGPLVSRLGQRKEVLYGVTLDADENIVTAGFVYDEDNNIGALVERYTPVGELDTSFAGTGYVVHEQGTFGGGLVEYYVNARVDSRGRVVAFGFSDDGWDGGAEYDRALLARYTPDGRLDSTFNPQGSPSPGMIQTINEDGNSVFGREMDDTFWFAEFLPDDSFYIVGMSDHRTLVSRYTEDGYLAGSGEL